MLDFNYTILIQFLNFIILLILLNQFLFKPVLKALARRRAFMQALSDKVQEEEKQATDLTRTYDDATKERRRPILEQRDTTVKEAQTASMKVIEDARQELTVELGKMKERVKTLGYDLIASTPQQFAKQLQEDVARWGPVAQPR